MRPKPCLRLMISSTFVLLLSGASAGAEDEADLVDRSDVVYRVRITNITKGQAFSRIVLASHGPGVRLFELGSPAPQPLVALAENGDPWPLASSLQARADVRHVLVTEGPLAPGESLVVFLRGGGLHTRVSAAGKLVTTNDGFFALNGARVPDRRPFGPHAVPALDAGSESNDEQCDSIPGPYCGGDGGLDGEGFVHVHNGVHGIGDLKPPRHDWRNPVARVHIERAFLIAEEPLAR